MMCFSKQSVIGTACFLVALMSGTSAFAQQPVEEKPKITVSGESVVYVQPDKILVCLGAETWNADLEAAKAKNDEIVKKAIAAILKCDVEKKAIQTDNITISPTYKDYHWRGIIDGYTVNNTLTITVTKVALVEPLITAALKVGINRVNSVDFQTTELRKYRDQARQMALKAAREKANDMAVVLDQTIGKPLQIIENQHGGWYFYNGCHWGSSRDYGMSQNSMQNAPSGSGEAGEGETVALGKIGIRANVSVVFELKDKQPLANEVKKSRQVQLVAIKRSNYCGQNLIAKFIDLSDKDRKELSVIFPCHSFTTHEVTLMQIMESCVQMGDITRCNDWRKAKMEVVFSIPTDAGDYHGDSEHYDQWVLEHIKTK
jgi:uncharacterized protein